MKPPRLASADGRRGLVWNTAGRRSKTKETSAPLCCDLAHAGSERGQQAYFGLGVIYLGWRRAFEFHDESQVY